MQFQRDMRVSEREVRVKPMITLQDILEIENDEGILNFRCPETGYLMWPLIRDVFICFIISDLLYEVPLQSEQCTPRPQSAYLAVLKSCAHNILKGRDLKGSILISASGSHVLRNELYLNRLSDHFAFAAADKTITLEALFVDWHWPFPRYNNRVLFDAPILGISSLYGKFFTSVKHRECAKALIEFVTRRARNLLDWSLSEERSNFLTTILANNIAALPVRRHLYSRLFQQTGTRILIREEGCYGCSSVINTIAHDSGIITAEYQHGMVTAGHYAYNFAEALRSSEEYKKTLPQYFLSYGKWWTDQINAPVMKLNIGNPDRTESLKRIMSSNRQKIDLIVLGDGIETEKYLSFCTVLAKELGSNYRTVFRPHPRERERVLRSYGRKAGDVIIEWDKELLEAFETTDIVVSEVSTGLFEAIGLVNRIFLWDTPKAKFSYPTHPFTVFSDADDLVTKIQDCSSGRIDPLIAEEFWTPNWKQNYLAFLQSVCPGILDSTKC